MNDTPSRKHLVLLGTGRANVHVLKGLATRGTGGVNVTLAAPYPYYIDEALLPGHLAGECGLQDCHLPLDALVEASGVTFIPAHVLGLDPSARRVQLSSGDALPYDVLSIDVGPAQERDAIEAHMPGARRNALFTHPRETFLQLWPQLQALASERALQIAVIGSGVAGAELALAAASALTAPHGSRVTLVTDGQPLLHEAPPALQRRALARLKAMNITVLPDRCVALDGRELQLQSGATLLCDAPLLALGLTPPAWLQASGLALHDDGHPVINERLQSDSHRQVFIVPDSAPPEVGPVLDANLATALYGGSFKKAPAAPRLRLMNAGERHAIATWGPLGLEGREVWQWKSRRDRKQLADLLGLWRP
ncbi:MAG: FAD-dependent oxidoreductase [Comamonadaceae bacterium]|nr:FAD-dependent oxidoreductase [Comamonadaceae bacterium]